MNVKVFIAISTTFALLLSIGCSQRTAPSPADSGKIKIGACVDMTGPTSQLGLSVKNGIELARDEINASGGVNGRQVQILLEDNKGSADEARAAVNRLIHQHAVHALVGDVDAQTNLAAATQAQTAKVPMLSLATSRKEITQGGDYVFRAAFLDSIQGEQMGTYAFNNIRARTAAVFSEDGSEYSAQLTQSFEATFTRLGGQVNVKQSYAPSSVNFAAQLAALSAANSDVIYVPGQAADVARLAKEARQLGIKSIFLGADRWNDAKLFEVGEKAVDGSYITGEYSADDPEQRMRTFTLKYRQRFGAAPGETAALAYDAIGLLADALKRAAATGRTQLREAIAQTAKYPGITGRITFDSDRNATKPTTIFKIQDGKIVPVLRAED